MSLLVLHLITTLVGVLFSRGSSDGSSSDTMTPYTWAEKFESFEGINSIRETNGNFDPCNSCNRLVPSRLHELHESKFPFVSRIEFICSKLSIFFCSCIRAHCHAQLQHSEKLGGALRVPPLPAGLRRNWSPPVLGCQSHLTPGPRGSRSRMVRCFVRLCVF